MQMSSKKDLSACLLHLLGPRPIFCFFLLYSSFYICPEMDNKESCREKNDFKNIPVSLTIVRDTED